MRTDESRISRLRRLVPRSALPPAVATGCLLLAIGVGWSGVLFVVLDQVIPGWVVSAVLLVGSLVLMRVVLVRRRRSAAGGPPPRRVTPSRVVRGLLATVAGLVSAFGLARDVVADYHVLQPAGPDGCRAVVREAWFIKAGWGDVYAAGPIDIVREPSGSWRTDDGYRPIDAGTYELTWYEKSGRLRVYGDEVNPVMGGTHRVDCD
ncbi:hypothetical protein RM844_14180 [Streptomyces sp. DSM 44915]|uniref:Lipoprotein n=1 Tax=Streptomyces chisholmiae TaxID=3075540 RepID=A0ABU2JR31_9ACTN|nr:hypothetical protein [Streptomyces sp. DSM 44915]MDT0267435.1 hypothetical protein [Streptomyces sp. DSM 44915]